MARSAGVTRAQVVATAAALADRTGLEALTLAQVANEVGIRLPSLYNHVQGLAGLRYELALLATHELMEALTQASIGKAGDEAVGALAYAYRRYVLAHPGRYAATIRAPQPDDDALQALAARIIATISAVLAPYQLDEEQTIHAIRALRSIVHGFATLEQGEGFGLPIDREVSFQRLIAMYVRSLNSEG